MDNNLNTNPNKKEKEPALSLLRIPINFFEENKKNDAKIDNSNKDNLNINNSSSNTPTDSTIKLDNNTTSTTINISKDVEIKPSTTSSKSPSSTNTSNTTQNAINNSNDGNEETEEEQRPDDSIQESTQNDNTQSTEQPVPEDSGKNTLNTPDTSPQPQPLEQEIENNEEPTSTDSQDESHSTTPTSNHVPKNTPLPSEHTLSNNDNNLASGPKPKNTEVGNSKDDKTEEPIENSKDKNNEKQNSNANSENDNNNEKLDSLKDKFNNTTAGKKLNDAKDKLKDKFNDSAAGKKLNDAKDNLKNKVADKMADHPAASKALGGLKDAKNVADNLKDATNNLDAEKMKEAVGDAAVKVAGQAGDAVVPGAGKVIQAADKLVGQTEVGKKAKKALGGCLFFSGCLIPTLLIFLPAIYMVSATSWVTNLFSRNDTIHGTLSASDYDRVKTASAKYSMEGLINLTAELSDKSFWEKMFNSGSQAPIQDALETYMSDYYIMDSTDARKYKNEYGDLIEAGYLIPLEEGSKTSFGLAFDMLLSNYSIYNLKSKDPKNPNQHQALFEDVLNNFDELKSRFDGQVQDSWFNNLNTILDKKYPVYLENIDTTSTNPPKRSLRELLSDDKYDILEVNNAFIKHTNFNSEIINAHTELAKQLAMLEVMTYMLSLQKYYDQINEFCENIDPKYVNKAMFNDEFFAQFLTFTNIDHFLSLSSLANHSFTYEIAVNSIENKLVINTKDIVFTYTTTHTYTDEETGELVSETVTHTDYYLGITEFSNWFATYIMDPLVTQESYFMNAEVIESETMKYLFNKYDIEKNKFDSVKNTPEENRKLFFALFETATGIDISTVTGKTAAFSLDANGQVKEKMFYTAGSKEIPSIIAPGKAFPIRPNENQIVSVTLPFHGLYSTEAQKVSGHAIHNGIDYGLYVGTNIVAAGEGIAYIYKQNTGYGNYVKIEHDNGYVSIYAHGNGTFYISNGQRVKAGDLIMQSGNSGASTGPHLHFEVQNPAGEKIDPNIFITSNL